MSNLTESGVNNDSGNFKGKCVETRTTLISSRWQQAKTNIDEKDNLWNFNTIIRFLQSKI